MKQLTGDFSVFWDPSSILHEKSVPSLKQNSYGKHSSFKDVARGVKKTFKYIFQYTKDAKFNTASLQTTFSNITRVNFSTQHLHVHS